MKKTLFFALTFCTAQAGFAQTTEISAPATGKLFEHQVGVQLNELVRQVFNFNGSTTTTNTNPYLVTYSLNLAKSGWGIRLGGGYDYQSITTEDGITGKNTKLDDLHLRFGFEKRFVLSPKWTAGVGVDAIYNYDNNYTKTITRGFDTVTTTTTSKISSTGGGPMLWLRYNITKKVLIGTETSYYYSSGNQKDNIAITQRQFSGVGGGQLETTITTVDNQQALGKLSVPIAFFLIVRF